MTSDTQKPVYVPPQAVEVEKHVIGAMLLDAESVAEVGNLLKPSDFYADRHTAIMTAIAALALARIQVDLITLPEKLKTMGMLERAGGEAYLMEVSAEVVSSANITQHCGIIRDMAILRGAIRLATQTLKLAYGRAEVAEVTAQMERAAQAVRTEAETEHGVKLISPDEWIPAALAAYDEAIYRGESTGWDGLDQLYRLAPSQTNVWTGIPGHGKSEFLDALMMNRAIQSREGPPEKWWRTAYFSPENSPHRRHIQKLAEKAIGKPLYGHARMSKIQYERAVQEFLVNHYLFFKQGSQGASFEQVLQEAERITPRISALVVDPWNRLEARRPQGVSETDHILHSLRMAARFAENTGISLHIVAHPTKLEKDFKTDKIKIPGLYDISGSAHWYNAIDNGFTVFRNHETGKTEVHALKIRFKDNGAVGVQDFAYDAGSGRYIQSGQPRSYTQAQKNATQKKETAVPPGLPF